MRTFTIDDVMALRPCNSREWHERRWTGREALTALEILDMADAGTIEHSDAVWLGNNYLPNAGDWGSRDSI